MNRRNFLTATTPSRTPSNPVRLKESGTSQTPPVFARRSNTGLEPYAGTWGYQQAAHLLRRSMVGPTDAEIRKAVADGMNATVATLLQSFTPNVTMIQDWAGTDAWTRPATRPGDPTYTEDYTAWQTENFRRREMLGKWWHQVIATSPVSIQERMTIFWHNHFTSELQAVNFAEFMYTQNQLLRASILGNFKQFTKLVTKDMAMLIYLDGVKNWKRGTRSNINENYARELMELYTVGVADWEGNPNYTQEDVAEAARALSGWTFTASSKGTNYAGLQSQFLEVTWDNGNKTLMGQTGNWKADDVVDIIFAQRADQVARYMCEKFYRAFVYDVPDRVVIEQMAQLFKGGNWEVKPVIETLLKSAHFYDETNIGAMDRSPVDFIVGMIRGMAIGTVPDFSGQAGRTTRDLTNRLSTLGMQLFDPPNVKGWPGGRTWISTSTLPPRQKFAMDVANGVLKIQNRTIYTFDPLAFGKSFPEPNDIHKLAADMAMYLLNTPPSTLEAEALYNTLLDGGVDYEWDINDPDQKPGDRIKKFLVAAFQLAKFQLY